MSDFGLLQHLAKTVLRRRPLLLARGFQTSHHSPLTTNTIQWRNPQPISRFLSTSPKVNTKEEEEDGNPPAEEIILYERKTKPSTSLMKSGFFVSIFHSSYWIWYSTDFIPAVNMSPMPELYVSPWIGYAGIAFALGLQLAFTIYPKRLVSVLSYRPSESKVMVYTHRLPHVRPALFPSASFPVGTHRRERNMIQKDADNKLKFLKLDPTGGHAQHILKERNGDIAKFRGHLPVGPRWPKYVLDIQSTLDVPEPELLLEALLRPEYFFSHETSNEADEGEYSSLRLAPKRKKQKRRGSVKKIGKRR